MANLKDGSIGRDMANRVKELIDAPESLPVTKAIEKVAEDLGKPAKTVSSAYYRNFPHGDIGHRRRRRRANTEGLQLGTPSGNAELETLVSNVQQAQQGLSAAVQELEQYVRANNETLQRAAALFDNVRLGTTG